MKCIYKILVALLLLPALIVGCKKSEATAQASGTVIKAPANFRVIGYMLATDIANGNAANFDFSKINYLNIAFITPDLHGNFTAITNLNAVIAAAHQQHVKVLASIGGGLAPAYYTSLLSDSLRSYFINNLVQLAVADNFDGIDVDLEGALINTNYETFVGQLSAAVKAQGMLLTAAIATAYKSSYTDRSLTYYDFVNVMSYDATGPWAPNLPGQDSPYSMAVSDLAYWSGTRGIAKNRLNLGVPFYGYGFNGAPSSIYYKDIVAQYPGAENTDQVSTTGGGIIYYNGIPTIKQKTAFAIKQAGGVMMWQLLQDAGGDQSLLNAIDGTVNGTGN